MKKVFPITLVALMLIFTSCLKDDIVDEQQDPTNKEIMKQLKVENPAIWNGLATQSIDLTSFEASALKSAAAEQVIPASGYLFSIFEDLFPSEGDYDFNDVMLRWKLTIDRQGNQYFGKITTTLINRGGSLPVEIGLMFYNVDGDKFTRIPNTKLKINGNNLSQGNNTEPWLRSLPDVGEEWVTEYRITGIKSNSMWIGYFIKTDKGEILSSGFAPTSQLVQFTVPQPDFLSERNLPWGLEIEAESFDIPNEKELFLNCYPEFKEWAESNGNRNPKWFEEPNSKYTTPYVDVN